MQNRVLKAKETALLSLSSNLVLVFFCSVKRVQTCVPALKQPTVALLVPEEDIIMIVGQFRYSSFSHQLVLSLWAQSLCLSLCLCLCLSLSLSELMPLFAVAIKELNALEREFLSLHSMFVGTESSSAPTTKLCTRISTANTAVIPSAHFSLQSLCLALYFPLNYARSQSLISDL